MKSWCTCGTCSEKPGLPMLNGCKAPTTHAWQTCTEVDCEVCQALVNDGTVIACDHCGEPGHTDSPGGWSRDEDGSIYCHGCVLELGITPV